MKKFLVPILSIVFAIALCLIPILGQTAFSKGGENSGSHSHEFEKNIDEKYLKTQATCYTKAAYYLSCSCGARSERTFEGGDYSHVEAIDEAVPATCETSGLTEGKHCSRCNKILVRQTTISPEHNFVDGICTRCNTVEPNGLDFFTYTLLSDGTYAVSPIYPSYPTARLPQTIVIPESYEGIAVTQIGEKAFADLLIKHIVIPNGITSIGDYAFHNCKYLTSINIPDSVTKIGFGAFSGCGSLTSVTIPAKVSDIDSFTFGNCKSMEEIKVSENNEKYVGINNCLIEKRTKKLVWGCKNSVIPNDGSVIKIDYAAFKDCSGLTSITIPASIREIASNAFVGCSGLEKIEVESGNKIYKNINNCLIKKDGKTLVLGCKNSVIPADSIIEIADQAFDGCSDLKSIAIPEGVTKIGNLAFSDCVNLTNISLPDSLNNLGYGAFQNCGSLKNIRLPENLREINNYAFYGCGSLENITIPNNVTVIHNNAFSGCESLTSVDIPYGVRTIEDGTFYGCKNLTSVTMPDTVKVIETDAFNGCIALTDITISDRVTSIGENAFYNCYNLKSIIISDDVTNIEPNAFANCSGIERIIVSKKNRNYDGTNNCLVDKTTKTLILGCKNSIIPTDGSVTRIGKKAFYNCAGLTGIYIPETVTAIDDYAFSGCTDLENIYFSDKLEIIGDFAFSGCESLKQITLPNSAENIGGCVFSGCENLESVTLPDNLSKISGKMFSDCVKLADISFPNSLTSIEYNAFSNCTKLKKLYIPENVTSIDYAAFEGCGSLEEIIVSTENKIYIGKDNCLIEKETKKLILGCKNSVIPEDGSVTSIVNAFYNCFGLKNVYIPSNITFISFTAFAGCVNLEDITVSDKNRKYYVKDNCLIDKYEKTLIAVFKNFVIPADGSVTEIGGNVFRGRNELTNIEIPDNITAIGGHTFADCKGLTNVIIPNNVTTMSVGAFSGCSNLTSITISRNLLYINADFLRGCKKLTRINFTGTKFEWESMDKGLYWDTDTGDYIVYCSDGKLDKNGNETA